jgi:hypothetical protein
MSTLTFKLFSAKTEKTKDICTLVFQDHSPAQEIDLYDYGFDKRNQWYSFIRSTINAREHVSSILRGSESLGFVHSFAKAYSTNEGIQSNDHIIAEFSGYGYCTGWTYIISLNDYKQVSETKTSTVIDDYDLLMQKFMELQL